MRQLIYPGMVKLCSLREVEHAEWATSARASLYGMIFAPGRRTVTVRRAKEIDRAFEEIPRDVDPSPNPFSVGVFVDHDVVKLNNIVSTVRLMVVQLHGDEPPSYVKNVKTYVIKTIRPKPGETLDMIASRIDAYESLPSPPVAYLIDGFHADHAGGLGVLADWEMARNLAERFQIILAGGLTPDNVATAIEAVRPYGVDVSSGVETEGAKDRQKMFDFVANAKSAFERVHS